ncbi:MAG TPA: nicotinate-nucleotide--dimethylbenzimidazole phosphoribosyltransferase [Acidimicrobiales bacterium]|nr:nicotinate-nucleotide--dimethylbenzimidazole phosphoribosyltransferase [Acidimicrobiales bacterium]
MPAFDEAASRVGPPDAAAAEEARRRHDRLTKPAGSLGRLEDAGVRLCAIAGFCPPPVPEPAAVGVFAGDHGVLAEGVSPWPQEVTAQMVANFCAGGAAVNVLAAHVGADVIVVDVGVAGDLPAHPRLRSAKVRRGTANLADGPAMTLSEARQALDVGAQLAAGLAESGTRCLLTGDMGIGNTTPSAALIAALTGRAALEVTGRGTGIDDERWAVKVRVVESAVSRAGDVTDPVELLATIGGLEIAALAGFVIGGAAARLPVLLDGVIAGAAALVATAILPECAGYLFAGHRSTEPGATAALDHLELKPLIDLDLRLGEGTGACLALPVLQGAAKILRDMATFESAGVTEDHG